jgi:hypothetical protein
MMEEPVIDPRPREDIEISAVGSRLQALKDALGSEFWKNPEARALQQDLRRRIGEYGAWGEDKLPLHQRARRAASLESQYAHLLWPGRSDQ